MEFLRPEKKFNSIEDLKAQIKKDIAILGIQEIGLTGRNDQNIQIWMEKLKRTYFQVQFENIKMDHLIVLRSLVIQKRSRLAVLLSTLEAHFNHFPAITAKT